MKTLLLVDGNAIIHRAFYALPPFKAKDGTPTNAVYGFMTMFLKALQSFKPNYVVVCFDTPEVTFRKKIFKEYQGQRPKLAEEFKTQIPLVKKMLDKGGIFHIEKPGVEADDLIGTIVDKVKGRSLQVLILSGDKDILQLVDKNIFVISPQVGLTKVKIFDKNLVKDKFGLAPRQIADFKALSGDQSDNYRGAKGIGPKTAVSLIKKYGGVEELFDHLEEISKERLRKILLDHKKEIFLAKKLAVILSDVPIRFHIEETQFKGFNPQLKDFLQNLGMKSLVKRIFPPVEKRKDNFKKEAVNKKKSFDSVNQENLF